MRAIDAAILNQIQSGEIRAFVCFYANVGSGYRFTNCDVDLWVGGVKYSPRGMEPGNFSYSKGKIVDQAVISIDNTDDALTPDLVGSVIQDAPVKIYGVYLDADYSLAGAPVTLFEGEIDDWRNSGGTVDITIANQFSQWNRRTFSQHQSSCRWKLFKGARCTYAGAETWCDRSYARCSALGNTAYFGGFRWLPSVERADVQWGSVSPQQALERRGNN